MSIVNYNNLLKTIIGSSVPKPISGTLSGHAAGEPFDKYVYSELKYVTDQIGKQIYETNCTKQLLQVAEEKAEYRRTLKEKVI